MAGGGSFSIQKLIFHTHYTLRFTICVVYSSSKSAHITSCTDVEVRCDRTLLRYQLSTSDLFESIPRPNLPGFLSLPQLSLSAEGELTFKLAASADQQPTHGRCCTSSTELRLLSFFAVGAVRKAGQISRIFPEKYSGKNWWWRFIAGSSYK